MITHIKNLLLLSLLIAGFALMLAGRVTAQTFTTLHSFTETHPYTDYGGGYSFLETNSDGVSPEAGLILTNNILYGTAEAGGGYGRGTVFAVKIDGSGFTTLHTFNGSDGWSPLGGVILSSNTLYGTTWRGNGGNGTVFSLTTDGTGFTNLHGFSGGSGGALPAGRLILSGKTLFGAAGSGGNYGGPGDGGSGTVFAVNTDGTGFTNLHSFTAGPLPYQTNSDGANPNGGLILSGNYLYGTAPLGGSYGNGTVFALHTDGTGFKTLHNFSGIATDFTNNDGSQPNGGLILSGRILYGTAWIGGSGGSGTVFKLNTDGTEFTTLHSFTAPSGPSSPINRDGANPNGGLIVSGTTLYGTTTYGGSSGVGTVFSVNTDGSDFTTLHTCRGDGGVPIYGPILSGNSLYGPEQNGGSAGNGALFALTFSPKLSIIPSETTFILTWPTNYAGFDYSGYALQSNTNLASPVWSTNSSAPVVVNGQVTVTNSMFGTQAFYRLSQ